MTQVADASMSHIKNKTHNTTLMGIFPTLNREAKMRKLEGNTEGPNRENTEIDKLVLSLTGNTFRLGATSSNTLELSLSDSGQAKMTDFKTGLTLVKDDGVYRNVRCRLIGDSLLVSQLERSVTLTSSDLELPSGGLRAIFTSLRELQENQSNVGALAEYSFMRAVGAPVVAIGLMREVRESLQGYIDAAWQSEEVKYHPDGTIKSALNWEFAYSALLLFQSLGFTVFSAIEIIESARRQEYGFSIPLSLEKPFNQFLDYDGRGACLGELHYKEDYFAISAPLFIEQLVISYSATCFAAQEGSLGSSLQPAELLKLSLHVTFGEPFNFFGEPFNFRAMINNLIDLPVLVIQKTDSTERLSIRSKLAAFIDIDDLESIIDEISEETELVAEIISAHHDLLSSRPSISLSKWQPSTTDIASRAIREDRDNDYQTQKSIGEHYLNEHAGNYDVAIKAAQRSLRNTSDREKRFESTLSPLSPFRLKLQLECKIAALILTSLKLVGHERVE